MVYKFGIVKTKISIEIKRIKAPKFRVGKYVLNEYELRQLMLDVAMDEKPAGIKVKDENGLVGIIRWDGKLTEFLSGMQIADNLTLKLWDYNEKKHTKEVH